MYLGVRKKVTMATISLLGNLIQKYVANWVLLGYSVLTILLVFSCFQEKRWLKKKRLHNHKLPSFPDITTCCCFPLFVIISRNRNDPSPKHNLLSDEQVSISGTYYTSMWRYCLEIETSKAAKCQVVGAEGISFYCHMWNYFCFEKFIYPARFLIFQGKKLNLLALVVLGLIKTQCHV